MRYLAMMVVVLGDAVSKAFVAERGLAVRIVAGIGAVLGPMSVAVGEELVIADQEKSDYSIVIAVDATMQDSYAAQVLQRYIREMSGADLPIAPDSAPVSEKEIVVGFNRHSK